MAQCGRRFKVVTESHEFCDLLAPVNKQAKTNDDAERNRSVYPALAICGTLFFIHLPQFFGVQGRQKFAVMPFRLIADAQNYGCNNDQ